MNWVKGGRLLKDYQLLWAMLLGVVLYPLLIHVRWMMPWLIFIMLTLNYTKIAPTDLKPKWQHLFLLALTVCLGIVFYLMFKPINIYLALGALIIFFTPTATAAGVVTNFLGGDISFVTSYLILGNILAAFAIPIIVPLVGMGPSMSFYATFMLVIQKVMFLLMGPLMLVWLLRFLAKPVHDKLEKYTGVTIYFWSLALAIVTATTIHLFITNSNLDVRFFIYNVVGALVICLITFGIGRYIGRKTLHNPVTLGQSFGQKNTVLAIWIATTFISPLASVLPAAYVIWQNIINALQLAKHRKKEREN